MNGGTLPYRDELEAAVAAVRAAGTVVREFYDGATAATYQKGDGSPVTDADLAADSIIRQTLIRHFPADPILSEEGSDDERRLRSSRCWIVDPIDGTEQFIAHTGEFDVLVALIENGHPVAAAGLQPTTGLMVTATKDGGAWLSANGARPRRLRFAAATDPLRLGSSKWFGAPDNETILGSVAERLGVAAERPSVTGFSPRLFLSPRSLDCMIGVRPGPDQTMASEWDFAVTDLVIHEAGGRLSDLEDREFHYNKPNSQNTGGMIAAVDLTTHARVVAAVRAERGVSWRHE